MIKNKAKSVLFHIVALAVGMIAMIPFFWMVSTSFKSQGALMTLPIQWIPSAPTLEAYTRVFSMFPFARAIFNSLFIAVSYTLITILASSMAAFVFAKMQIPFANGLFKVYLASMMIPTQITLIPLFVVMNKIGLINTYGSVIFPSLFRAFAVFMLVQTMKTIPNDFLEAARIDGANPFQIYRKIMMPMCAPTIATLCVTTFMDSWNDYLWTLVMLSN